MLNLPDDSGSYIIIGELPFESSMISGPFGGQMLPGGFYLYSGSAFGPGGLRARISRHIKKGTEKKFWHFDYLKDFLNIKEIWYSVSGSKNLECQFIKKLQGLEFISFPILKFGASDCHFGCPAHLARFSLGTDVEIIFNCLAIQGFTLQKFSFV
jgi:Uri superfamily endonuclease